MELVQVQVYEEPVVQGLGEGENDKQINKSFNLEQKGRGLPAGGASTEYNS